MSGLNLLAGDGGLFCRQEARVGLALDRAGEAEVRAMTSLGVIRTGAARFAALDGAFGQGAAAHGFGFSQFGGEMAEASGRWGVVHGYLTAIYAVRTIKN
ncbi:MAG: hypothetical protein DMG77_03015 [Acidobacteria bacterium]|nr:MAG: hypothetical protein DMG77_03015 [Acidobacteriota bacterium]